MVVEESISNLSPKKLSKKKKIIIIMIMNSHFRAQLFRSQSKDFFCFVQRLRGDNFEINKCKF